ncbi:MAG TPA: hypothetical protein PLR28_06225 [Dokdonella sp.]|uniref:hypothetical protein n=2 Tax=Dokdonella sp. TaxID=2291710 RepID=UPI002BAD81BA|nr:hypothetical protein [Dokdonella sp.]HOX72647.1 hypothetical protein [Dokdonella sp.]HPG94135.1 hypothetical protein [Dokdonella sp.]HPN78512.1 hypothetical protein [Dokdonella sp.]
MNRCTGRFANRILSRLAASIACKALIVTIAVGLLAGCAKPPPPPKAVDLAYPVLVLFEQSGAVRHDDAGDLAMMAVQRIMASASSPLLIDSRLDIYRLDDLESVHSGLWLMANPSGLSEVRFALHRESTADLRRARQLVAARARVDAQAMARIAQAKSLAELIAAIGK